MHPDAMPDSIDRRRFLACLSDPSRFDLVTRLAAGPRCVTDLAVLIGLSQSCTTRHLQALLREEIVVAERRGRRVVYALRQEGDAIHPVLRWACEAGENGELESSATHGLPSRAVRSTAERRSLGAKRRARAELEIDELSPAIAVEHEGGWIGADLGSPDLEPAAASRNPEADGRARSEPPAEGTSRRTELDDFLL